MFSSSSIYFYLKKKIAVCLIASNQIGLYIKFVVVFTR